MESRLGKLISGLSGVPFDLVFITWVIGFWFVLTWAYKRRKYPVGVQYVLIQIVRRATRRNNPKMG